MKRSDDPRNPFDRPDKRFAERIVHALRHHVPYEEMKMRRKSSKLKKALQGAKKANRREIDWEDDGIAPDVPVAESPAPLPEIENAEEGMVVSISRRTCRVFNGNELLLVTLPKTIAREQQTRLAVGDRVRYVPRADKLLLAEVLPRQTLLSRPDPHDPEVERAIAANIDQVVHVVSVKEPPLHVRLIDRYMIAAERGNARYLLCVNKVDLLKESEKSLPELDPYRAMGVPMVFCSTKVDDGANELRAALEGKTSVLVGHSGVGKSSLLNRLDPELRLATQEISEAWGRGRHTTTGSTLFRFDDKTFVIDTPGIRELGLWDLPPENLIWYFPEFEPFADECHFRNCSHTHEPACGVRERVEEGELPEARYETYTRLYEELSEKA